MSFKVEAFTNFRNGTEKERKRKASGKTYLIKSGHSPHIKGAIEDVDYEEIK